MSGLGTPMAGNRVLGQGRVEFPDVEHGRYWPGRLPRRVKVVFLVQRMVKCYMTVTSSEWQSAKG